MSTHLEELLQRDLNEIRAGISKMADLAAWTLRDCTTALQKKDRQLAMVIILRDQQIDALEKKIDRACLEFILRHQPAGAHLRFAYATLHINFELERVGDYAESIARQILKLIEIGCTIPDALFSEIAPNSISMLQNAVRAFVREDAALAEATSHIEEQIDVIRNQISSELMHLVQNNMLPLAALTPLATIARRFERVSDQAKSICQETLYICTGEFAKHPESQVYRVLFVDDEHGCLSRMAEAIGKALDRPEFEFSSAGLNPRPLDQATERMLADKGIHASSQVALAAPNARDMEQYQIVVAFSESTRKQLPPPNRKSVQLQWIVTDPCVISASPERRRNELDRAHTVISRQILDLISSLIMEQSIETTGAHL